MWLGNGLLNDHTDGHVDNLARFVGPNRVAIPEAAENDPNWQVYAAAKRDAQAAGWRSSASRRRAACCATTRSSPPAI